VPVLFEVPGGQALAPDATADAVPPDPVMTFAWTAPPPAPLGMLYVVLPTGAPSFFAPPRHATPPSAADPPRSGSVGQLVRRAHASASAPGRAARAVVRTGLLVALALLALACLGAAGAVAARIIRTPSPAPEGARPVAVPAEDPRRAGLAVRER